MLNICTWSGTIVARFSLNTSYLRITSNSSSLLILKIMEFVRGMKSTISVSSKIWRGLLWTRTWLLRFTTSQAGRIFTGSQLKIILLSLTNQLISLTNFLALDSWDLEPVLSWPKLATVRKNLLSRVPNSWLHWMECLTTRTKDATANFSTWSKHLRISWPSMSLKNSKTWKTLAFWSS